MQAPSSGGRSASHGRRSAAATAASSSSPTIHVRRSARPLARGEVAERGIDQRVGDAGVLDLVAQLGPDEPGVQGHDDRAEERGGEAQLDDLGPVRRQRRDPGLGPDAGGGQHGGEAGRAVGDLGVGPRAAVPPERHPRAPQPLATVGEVAEHHAGRRPAHDARPGDRRAFGQAEPGEGDVLGDLVEDHRRRAGRSRSSSSAMPTTLAMIRTPSSRSIMADVVRHLAGEPGVEDLVDPGERVDGAVAGRRLPAELRR